MDFRLFWLAIGSFAIGAEGFVVSSLLPAISADTHVSLRSAGYLVLCFGLAFAAGGPVVASQIAHRDRRLVLTVAILIFSAGNLLAGVAQTYDALLVARTVMGLAAAAFAGMAQATAVALCTPDQRARAISVVVGGTTTAIVVGAPAGALIGSILGWRATFFSLAILAALCGLAFAVVLPAGVKAARLNLTQRLQVATKRGMAPALASTLLYMTSGFITFTYIAPIAAEAGGIGPDLLPIVLLLFGIGAASGNYLGGRIADRFGARRVVIGATTLMTFSLAAISMVSWLPPMLARTAFIAAMLPWGLVGWAFTAAQASRVARLAGEAAPLGLSLNYSAVYLGLALSALVGNMALAWTKAADLGWVGALFSLAALCVLLIFP